MLEWPKKRVITLFRPKIEVSNEIMHTDVYFIAQHDYETQQADEIGLYQGDIIRFLDPLENGWAIIGWTRFDWWTGRLSDEFRCSIWWSEKHEILKWFRVTWKRVNVFI